MVVFHVFDVVDGDGRLLWRPSVAHIDRPVLVECDSELFGKAVHIGQGKDAAKQYLMDNPDVAEQVEVEVRAKADILMGKGSKEETPIPPDAASDNFDD